MTLLGVFGNPIAHSRSPEVHLAFAAQHGLQLSYEKLLVPEGRFVNVANTFLAKGAIGFNITLPNKVDAYHFVDKLSDDAKKAGAVNTVVKGLSGDLIGHNTDGIGLVNDMQNNLSWCLKDKRILLIGAGGAARGVIANLVETQPSHLHVYNRTKSKAESMVHVFNDDLIKSVTQDEMQRSYDIVISASSAGLIASADAIDLPKEIVGPETCCYDMIYGEQKTPFQLWCENLGSKHVADGFGMLVEQAAAAFTLWMGYAVDTQIVIQKLKP